MLQTWNLTGLLGNASSSVDDDVVDSRLQGSHSYSTECTPAESSGGTPPSMPDSRWWINIPFSGDCSQANT